MTVLNLVKNDVKAELQNYLREKEINALFVSIVESLLLEKPEEPISFIFRFLAVRTIRNIFVLSWFQSKKLIFTKIICLSSPLGQVSLADNIRATKNRFGSE